MGDWNTWKISSDERCKHDERFQFLRPVNGYITGEQARDFFTQSKLPTSVLAKIWALADITADGKLDKKEFSIAMFLIKKCIEGGTLPMQLPPSLLQEPQRFIPSSSHNVLTSTTVAKSNSSSGTADSGEWSISATSRPKYKLQFNQNDRNKRGYLTGVEARGVFLKSNLPQAQLALIWNLADIDKDGNLTCDEFCIAAYLIDQVLAGRKLPTTLPPSLLPTSYAQQNDVSKSTVVASEHKDEGRVTFEDKRMQNFLLGQAELDKRKQDLAEQLRQEEEQRREQARVEAEKQEKLRLEKERERQKQAAVEAERQRALEARRQQAATARLQATREELRRRAIEAEKARFEALLKERAKEAQAFEQAKAHRASLQEAAGSQTTRRQAAQTRFEVAQAEVDAHKLAIRELAGRRDAVERECRDLTEHVEAAKAELHRWQREYEQLQRQVATSVGINYTSEQQKTLRANLKQVNDSKRQLELQLGELEAEVTQRGQTLASHRHLAQELAKKRSILITEMKALLATLLERRRTLREKRKSTVAISAATVASTNSITSTSLAAGLSEPYVALYAYSPTRSDELAFAEHDQIQILTNPPFEVCEGWLYGELDGRYGLVPATYVRKISASEVAAGLNSTLPADPFALPTSTTAENPTGNPFPAFETPAQQPNSLPLSDDAPVESVEFDGEKPLFACLALYNFDAAHPGDLSLQINDKVDVFVDNSGWYEGVSRRTGQRGIFPANHVQKLQSDAEVPSTSAATQASAFTILATVADTTKTALPGSAPAPDTSSAVREDKSADEGTPARPTTDRVDGEEDEAEAVITVSDSPELAVAVTPFTAQSSEQLSLTVGQYVKILKRSSTGWWEGETQLRGQDRQIGWFPSDYVRLVGATTTTSAPNEPSPAHHVGDPSKNAQPPAATQGSGPPNSQGTVSPAGEPQQSSSASVVTADLSSASVVQSMFAYKASQPDELTFPEGALIEVLAHEEEGWWRGRIQSTGVEGLFPVNYVKPYAKPANAPASSPLATASNSRPSKSSIPVAQDHRSTRQNILLEFVESERQYYRDLFEVKEKIYEGLKKQNVGEKKLSQIFCNWATLCDISEAFNKDFQERKRLIAKNPNELIGDILVRHLPKCMVYRDFCANQDVALSRLEKLCEENPDVASFLQSCQRLMRVRAMPLSSYFLKPMQRITKYKLLIEKLLKHTQPTHPDRANLEQSLELASTILDVCNEAIRNRENFVQLQWLQDHVAFASRDEEISFVGDELLSPFFGSRRLILSGTLFKVKSKKELTAFLFNDMLFLTQPINFSATTLPTGNFTLPLKPDASLKVFFRAYRKPLSTANIRVSETVLSRPRRRSAWIGGLSQASASDLSTVGVAETTTVGREPRAKRRTLANFRQLSLSMNNLSTVSADTAASPSTSFFITDDTDRAIFLHVRAPSEALKATWLEKIRKTSTDHQRLMNRFKDRGSLRSDTGKGSLFAAVLNLTVISATGLRLVGPNADEMPWPYCEVSVCLRSKKTNVILSTTSPKWNCPLRFTVKDLSRDVITLTVYSKNASAVEEFLGRVEVSMEAVARHCRSKPNGPWETKFPLVVGGDDDDDVQHDASLTVSFTISESPSDFEEASS